MVRPLLVVVALASPLAACGQHTPARLSSERSSTLPAPPVVDPYADLAPLGRAVGDARIVALGEPCHAEGNMFAEQARIVAFLHERLGFTVLAWEAGLWSCETDPAHCLTHAWGAAVETRSVRPPPEGMTTTGFDFQPTGPARTESLARLRDQITRAVAADAPLVARVTTAFERFPKMQHFRPLTLDERAGDRQVFRDVLSALEAGGDVPDRPLLIRAVENVVGLYDWHEAVHADVSTTIDWNHNDTNNVRDRAMADNVLWLAKERYPRRKIVLWLATFHAARDLAVLTEPVGSVDPTVRAGFRPMGSWLADALGRDYFAVGMTAYDGKIGNPPDQRALDVGVSRSGSFEDRLKPANAAFRFVSREELGDEPVEARFIGLHAFVGPWGRVLDGGIVFRTVTPTTAETAQQGN